MQSALHASSDDGVPHVKPNVPLIYPGADSDRVQRVDRLLEQSDRGRSRRGVLGGGRPPACVRPAAYGVMGFEGAWSAIALIAVHMACVVIGHEHNTPSNNPSTNA